VDQQPLSALKGSIVGQVRLGRLLLEDKDDQYALFGIAGGRRALLIRSAHRGSLEIIASNAADFIPDLQDEQHLVMFSQKGCCLERFDRLRAPDTKASAMGFARVLSAFPRDEVAPQRSFYLEQLGAALVLPVGPTEMVSKEIMLGRYLTNGADIEADDLLRVSKACPRLSEEAIGDVIREAGLQVRVLEKATAKAAERPPTDSGVTSDPIAPFELPGRPDLQAFFNEHVIDVVNDLDRYRSLGIKFPGGILLHGPPGCGKTFAVQKFVEHLNWPSQSVDASSIASPYIHETSRRIAEVFKRAIETAPSLIVIDEIDAFLSSRESDSQSHRIEEVAEFLRRIPDAADNEVLLIGMTNRLDAIDAAIVRRGRFDHLIEVGPASAQEIEGMLAHLLRDRSNIVQELANHARALSGRPLSDVAHVVDEAARRAARERRDSITDVDVQAALAKSLPRDRERRRIGF
jgi:Cdc6-like AAA superfamily ATPase